MTKITDPDLLAQGTEVVFDTSGKTIQLLKAGDLSDDGVTLQCIYSFCKEEWKADADLIAYPFPLVSITEQKFDLVNGWDWEDATTRGLIRDGGWALKDTSNVSQEEWMGFKTLGTIQGAGQVYYQQVDAALGDDVLLTGAANQAVQVYGDVSHGDFDYRAYFKCFVREYAMLYDSYTIAGLGLDEVTYQVYGFPLSNQTDLKITHDDTYIEGNAPYTGMTITWYTTPESRSIGGTDYDFSIIIDANGGTKEQVYEFVQHELRQDTDIDDGAGTRYGSVTPRLLQFVGDTLVTNPDHTTDWGVFIDDFAVVDTNKIQFYDDTGTLREFPYVAAGYIYFNEYLEDDTDAIYRMYVTSTYGTASAELVLDNSDTDIAGDVDSNSSIAFDFDWDGNTQDSRTPGVDPLNVTVVAIGLQTGQFVKTTGQITESIANSFSLVAALERNYTNPA